MRSLGWTVIQQDWCRYKETGTDLQRGKAMWRHREKRNHLEAKERGPRNWTNPVAYLWPQAFCSLWTRERYFSWLSCSAGYLAMAAQQMTEQPWEANTQGCTELTTEAPKAPRWETLAQDANWEIGVTRTWWPLDKVERSRTLWSLSPTSSAWLCWWKNFGQRSLIREGRDMPKQKQSKEN